MSDEYPTLLEVAKDALGFLMSKARRDPEEREIVFELRDAIEREEQDQRTIGELRPRL